MAISLNTLDTDFERSMTSIGLTPSGANRGTYAGVSTLTGTNIGTNVDMKTAVLNIDAQLSTTNSNLGTASTNSVVNNDANQQSMIGGLAIGGNVDISGTLTVTGSTTTVNSTTTTIADPIFTLGGTEAPTGSDSFDRGIEYHWFSGSAKKGFFGLDKDQNTFTFIPDATNAAEVFSGAAGNCAFADGNFTGTVTAFNFAGSLTGTADAAGKWAAPMTLTASNHATGTVSFDGSGAADIALTIDHATANIYTKTEADALYGTKADKNGNVAEDFSGKVFTFGNGATNFTVEHDSGTNELKFKYGATTIFKIRSNGEMVALGDVIANGTM